MLAAAPPPPPYSGTGPSSSVPVSSLIPELLECGTPHHASNLIDLLNLEGALGFSEPLTNLTRSLSKELSSFNQTAASQLHSALDELPIATSIFHNQTSSLLPPGLSSSLKDLRNASNAMLTILPASEEPPVTPIEPRVAWIALFDELYGTTGIIGPDPEMVALNANIRATLTLIANLTEPLEQNADNCNDTANAAPEQLTSIEASLTAALKVCEATTEEGAALEQQLSDVIDSAAHAEAVTVCGWVHDCYQRAMDLTCNNGHEQLELFGILLSAAAIALWIGVCALCCTRQVRPPVALSRRASPDTPQRGGGSGSSGGMRPRWRRIASYALSAVCTGVVKGWKLCQEEHVVAVGRGEPLRDV